MRKRCRNEPSLREREKGRDLRHRGIEKNLALKKTRDGPSRGEKKGFCSRAISEKADLGI